MLREKRNQRNAEEHRRKWKTTQWMWFSRMADEYGSGGHHRLETGENKTPAIATRSGQSPLERTATLNHGNELMLHRDKTIVVSRMAARPLAITSEMPQPRTLQRIQPREGQTRRGFSVPVFVGSRPNV
jgi:hypothetical protein